MALVQWKQIDSELSGSGNLTGSLYITGAIILNGESLGDSLEIFKQTGSYYATTNNIHITGSLSVTGLSSAESLKLSPIESPAATGGGIFYSSSNEYFLGFI